MKRLLLVLGCALWCAACGEDDAPEQKNPPEGWVYCNDAELILRTNEDILAMGNKDCNAVQGNLDIYGGDSLVGLEKLEYISGNLVILNTNHTDLSPLLGLKEVDKVSISGNDELDNCQATALAYQLTGDSSLVKDNKGSAICTEFPK